MLSRNPTSIIQNTSHESLKNSFELANLRSVRFHQKTTKSPEHITEQHDETVEKVKNVIDNLAKNKTGKGNNHQQTKDQLSILNKETKKIIQGHRESNGGFSSPQPEKKIACSKILKTRLLAKMSKNEEYLEDQENNNQTSSDLGIQVANVKNKCLLQKISKLSQQVKIMKLNTQSPRSLQFDSGHSSNEGIDDTSDEANEGGGTYARFRNKFKRLQSAESRVNEGTTGGMITSTYIESNNEKGSTSAFLNQEDLDNILPEICIKADRERTNNHYVANSSSSPNQNNRSLCRGRNGFLNDLNRNQSLLSTPKSVNDLEYQAHVRMNNSGEIMMYDRDFNQLIQAKSLSNSPSPKDISQTDRSHIKDGLNSSVIDIKKSEKLILQTSQNLNNLNLKLSLWKAANYLEFPNNEIHQLKIVPELFEIKESDKIDEDIQSTYFDNALKNNINKIDLVKKKENIPKKVANLTNDKQKLPRKICSPKPVFKHDLANIMNIKSPQSLGMKNPAKTQNLISKQAPLSALQNSLPTNNNNVSNTSKDKPKSASQVQNIPSNGNPIKPPVMNQIPNQNQSMTNQNPANQNIVIQSTNNQNILSQNTMINQNTAIQTPQTIHHSASNSFTQNLLNSPKSNNNNTCNTNAYNTSNQLNLPLPENNENNYQIVMPFASPCSSRSDHANIENLNNINKPAIVGKLPKYAPSGKETPIIDTKAQSITPKTVLTKMSNVYFGNQSILINTSSTSNQPTTQSSINKSSFSLTKSFVATSSSNSVGNVVSKSPPNRAPQMNSKSSDKLSKNSTGMINTSTSKINDKFKGSTISVLDTTRTDMKRLNKI